MAEANYPEKYMDPRIAAAGVSVQHQQDRAVFAGTRAQLIAAGLLQEEEFPPGRTRIVCLARDPDICRCLVLRRKAGGRFELECAWTREQQAYLQKRELVQRWIAAVPRDVEAFRDRLRRDLLMYLSLFRKACGRPDGGYRLDVDDEALAEASADLLELVDTAPVRFSARERQTEVDSWRAQAERLNPQFRGFLRQLTQVVGERR